MSAQNTPEQFVAQMGRGRPKGSKNKVGATAKDAIAMAAERMGGWPRLAAWAQEDPANERVFWGQVYTKLLPLQVSGDVGLTIRWPVAPPKIERDHG